MYITCYNANKILISFCKLIQEVIELGILLFYVIIFKFRSMDVIVMSRFFYLIPTSRLS